MNQTERILRHLQTFGAITSLEAIQDYGILRLASRISELKKRGCPFSGRWFRARTGTARSPASPGTASVPTGRRSYDTDH